MTVSSVVLLLLLGAAKLASASEYFGLLPPMDRAKRIEQASEWRRDFASIRASLPTLSPAEVEWLDTELKAIQASNDYDGARYHAFKDSRELRLHDAHRALRMLVDALTEIQKPAISQRTEAKDWAVVSDTFSDRKFWLDDMLALMLMGYIAPEQFKFLDQFGDPKNNFGGVLANASLQARVIQNRVVIPYLDGRLPE